MSDTWAPGDPFRLAALGDRYDGITGRVRGLWTDLGGREHAHVTHDDGTFASWQTARLERPDSATHAPSSQAGLASIIPSTGAVTAPTPSPVDDSALSLGFLAARSALLNAAIDWSDLRHAPAADVTPIQLFDADDALHTAVHIYRQAVSS